MIDEAPLYIDYTLEYRYYSRMQATIDDLFWNSRPNLPSGLELIRLERSLSSRPGPGGQDIDDVAELRWPGGNLRLMIGYKSPLLARDIPGLRKRLEEAGDRWRRLSADARHQPLLPAVVTAGASQAVVEACLAEGIAVFDLRGTVALRGPGVLIHTEGKGKLPQVHKTRGSMFKGTSVRVVRSLLASPERPITARAMATEVRAGYATTFNALSRLEQEGFVVRKSPRSGFILQDPLRLLRSWIESGERTAVAVDSFYAPAVDGSALTAARLALVENGIKGIWTVASALLADELHASGLPHGIYLSGSITPLEKALRLRRVTPHNFLVFRAEVAAETDAGGIYAHPRELPHGPGVALPQLAVDCAAAGGRGPEQARFLLQRYAETLRRRGGP